MEKGLFSGIILLIVIVFLTPSIIISDNTEVITNSYNHVSLLALSADNIVVDSLLDETFNSCSIATKSNYDSRVNNYLSSMLNETNKNSLDCEITIENSALSGDRFSGKLDLLCNNQSSNITSQISKEIYFDKEINVSGDLSDCNVSIVDNYISADIIFQRRP